MKKFTITILLLLSLFVVACATPPSDVPSAQVIEDVVEEPTAEVEAPVDAEVIEDEVLQEETIRSGEVAINTDASALIFEGYAVGKSHAGTFNSWSGSFFYGANGDLETVSGIIQTASVDTGIAGLDGHLKNEDFFEVETYPEIVIEFVALEADKATADITFRGVTKTVSFPAEVSNEHVYADFLLDTADFDMEYTGVNSEVRIEFDLFPTA